MNQKNTIIKIESLSKTFYIEKIKGLKSLFKTKEIEEVKALQGINFGVKKGEFIALLGPNGAGKSTLIKILIGVLAKDDGKVSVLGVDPLESRHILMSNVGIVFGQRSRMWYDLPVAQSFELTKRLYIEDYPKKKPRDQKKWENFLIKSIEIEHLLDRPVKKLSLGEKMRCELVNTLLYNPNLIFLDEPTIGLDVVSKQKIREALKILHSQGKTIILTSHDTGDIEKLCERVVVINHGKVVVDLPIQEFVKLEKRRSMVVKLEKPAGKDWKKTFENFPNIRLIMLSDYELRISAETSQFKEVVRTALEELSIDDLDFQSEGVEEILIRIYQKTDA